jgi:type II secretory pathway predicted ATPase ExeA
VQLHAPKTAAETSAYLAHHLALAGGDDALFSDATATLIHQTSRGYPRAVDDLAVHALPATYAAGSAIVDESATRAAITEITTD